MNEGTRIALLKALANRQEAHRSAEKSLKPALDHVTYVEKEIKRLKKLIDELSEDLRLNR